MKPRCEFTGCERPATFEIFPHDRSAGAPVTACRLHLGGKVRFYAGRYYCEVWPILEEWNDEEGQS